MASAQVVITNADDDTPAVGGVFEGISFFLVQRLPTRNAFIQQINANGGRVVKLEAQADHVVADHFRKDCPAGSISYKFIEAAIKNGVLPNPSNHKAGPAPGTIRETGAAIPGKSTRTPFTAEDDRVLWQWVERLKAKGYLMKGNEIYKQLEAKNPRHTYQAWRDRYIKRLMDKPPAGLEVTVAANAPPSPPTVQDEQAEISIDRPENIQNNIGAETARESDRKTDEGKEPNGNENALVHEQGDDNNVASEREPDFTEEDFNTLLKEAKNIENVPRHLVQKAWSAWSEVKPYHSAVSWCTYYQQQVRPVYLKQRAQKKRHRKQGHNRVEAKPTAIEKVNENPTVEEEMLGSNEEQREIQTASPSRPSGSKLQKGKRHNEGHQSPDPNARKKPRREGQEEPDIADKDEPSDDQFTKTHEPPQRASRVVSTQPIELLNSDDEEQQQQPDAIQDMPTSELNRAAQIQLNGEQQAQSRNRLPTSELNREAQAQLQDEEISKSDPQAAMTSFAISNLSTSQANILAGSQIPEELFERQQEGVDEVDGQSRSPAVMSSQVVHSVAGPVDPEIPGGFSESNGNLLTEANLASQQAQHKAELLSGTELTEVDNSQRNERQDEHAAYQQDVVKASDQPMLNLLATYVPDLFPQHEPRSSEFERLPQGLPTGLDFELSPVRDLPMSSQQEIDDSFEEAINWPESPKVSQRMNIQPYSVEFETQVTYPTLPSHKPEISQREAEQMPSSHPTTMPHVTYPLLPEQLQEASSVQPTGLQDYALDNERTSHSESPVSEGESSYVFIDNLHEAALSPREAVEDEIDLSVPEPEGGWDNLASSNKADSSVEDVVRSHLAILEEDSKKNIAEQRGSERIRVQEPKGNETFQEYVTLGGPSGPGELDDAEGDEEEIEMVQRGQDIVALSSNSSSLSSAENPEATDARHQRGLHKTALETQDILNAETQQPDFEMPLPPDSDEEFGVRAVDSDESAVDETPAKRLQESFSSPGRISGRRWTAGEDKLLLRGLRKGMSTTQIINRYRIRRSSSAIRNRRQVLQNQFPGGEIPRTNELHESEESGDEELQSDAFEPPLSPSPQQSSPPKLATSESQRNLPNIQKLPDEDIDSYVDKMMVYGFKEGSIINALKCTTMRPGLADLVLLEEKSGKGLPVDVAGIWSEEEDQTLESGNARGLRKLEEKHTWKECEERMQFLQDWREEE